jgi:hypothetical protein
VFSETYEDTTFEPADLIEQLQREKTEAEQVVEAIEKLTATRGDSIGIYQESEGGYVVRVYTARYDTARYFDGATQIEALTAAVAANEETGPIDPHAEFTKRLQATTKAEPKHNCETCWQHANCALCAIGEVPHDFYCWKAEQEEGD